MLALGMAVAVIAGCGRGGTPTPTPSLSPSASASDSPSASPSVTPPPAGKAAVYWVADSGMGLVLYREFIEAADGDPALAALRHIVAEDADPVDPDYTNLWGNGSTVNSVEYSGQLATVDITIEKLNVGAASEQRAIDQLVWTLTENHPETTQVLFKSGGEVIESFAGHVDARAAFSRQPPFEVLAPIWIDSPTGRVSNPVVATGTACTFEAAFAWELRRDGKTIAKGSGLADQACPVRSSWRIELGTLESGKYTLRVIDFSAEDGSVNQLDSKVFRVR